MFIRVVWSGICLCKWCYNYVYVVSIKGICTGLVGTGAIGDGLVSTRFSDDCVSSLEMAGAYVVWLKI